MSNEDMKPIEFIEDFAARFGYTLEDITSHKRTDELVELRSKITKTLRNDWKMSLSAIARLINRNHSSVINLYNREPKRKFAVPSKPIEKAMQY